MRYLKSTAVILLAMGSSVSMLSRSAMAQLAEADATVFADRPFADRPSADRPLVGEAVSDNDASEMAAGQSEPPAERTTRDLKSLLDGVQQTRSDNLLPAVSKTRSPQFSTSAPSLETPAESSPNRLSLDQFRSLVTEAKTAQSPLDKTSDAIEVVVEDRTEDLTEARPESLADQIAQSDDLPVLEGETPRQDSPAVAPGEPVPSAPGAESAPPSMPVPDSPLPNGQVEREPDVIQPIPSDAPVEGAEPELGDLPDILFADPNPLNLPVAPEGVDIERNPVVTLEQAIELAYRNNQALQTAVLQEEQAAAAVREQRAANLPTVAVGADLQSVEREGTDGGINPFTGETVPGIDSGIDTTLSGNLTVSYDVLTGGSRAASIRAAELQQQVSALAVETQQEQIRLATATAYYDLQESGENIRIQRSFLEEAERNLRDSRLRQEVGVGTRFDTLRAEVQFANARQQLIQAQGTQRISRRDIARLLNLPPNAGIQTTPVSVAENWPLTLEESILLAYQNRAELEQFLLQADISEQQRRIALASVRPRVSLFANYSAQDPLNSSGAGDSGFADNYSFGASFDMILFDGGAAKASARQQEIAGQINEEQFSEQSDQVRFDVEQAFFNLETNQENITTSRIAVSQAEEALELANLRLQAGVGTQLDVLTAQSELTTAQGNNVTAILNYNRALAAIQRAVSNVTIE